MDVFIHLMVGYMHVPIPNMGMPKSGWLAG